MENIINLQLPYILLALAMAVASGMLGSFAVMRKMALASDPISHIALPGLAIALLLGINPLVGAGAALLIGALVIWSLEKKTGISTDVMIGVVFSVSLAVGSLLTPDHEIIEALLGGYENTTVTESLVGTTVAILIVFFLIKYKSKLTLNILSPDLARTAGVNSNRLNLFFLVAFVATILLGLRFMGVLLMGSLIIIPAAVGKNLAASLGSMIGISTVVSVVSVGAGLAVSGLFDFQPGPTIIVISAAIFALSLLVKRPD